MLRTSFWIVILIALVINTIISFIAVFRQKREIATIWAWMLVLLLLPVVGFAIFFWLVVVFLVKRYFAYGLKNNVV